MKHLEKELRRLRVWTKFKETLKTNKLQTTFESLYEEGIVPSLINSIIWEKTKEGHDFWNNIYKQINKDKN